MNLQFAQGLNPNTKRGPIRRARLHKGHGNTHCNKVGTKQIKR